jgi:cupin superfamily acireductone dioxygenase involved in methionine salvage
MNHLIEKVDYTDKGYSPIVDFETWRVAILNYHPELLVEAIEEFHCHDKTDEVFILFEGSCVLYVADGDEIVTDIHCINMEKGKAYNVKKGVWHSHTLSLNGKVFIVENSNTSDDNSRKCKLSLDQREKMQNEYRSISNC